MSLVVALACVLPCNADWTCSSATHYSVNFGSLPEIASDVISDVSVEDVGIDVHVKFDFTGSDRS